MPSVAGAGAVIGLDALNRRPRKVAFVGNPNVGKSSLFNALTGLRQKVSNYPGTTVERVRGRLSVPGAPIEVVDLPGTYSLLPRSPDEAVVRDELLGRVPGEAAPDLCVVVLDASNLERNLFLCSQVVELGRPTVVALNQIDLALERGIAVDAAALSQALSVPVVPTSGRTGQGCAALAAEIARGGRRARPFDLVLPSEVSAVAAELVTLLGDRLGLPADAARARLAQHLASQALAEELTDDLERAGDSAGALAAERFRAARERLADLGIDVATALADARYAAIEHVARAVTTRNDSPENWRYRLDRVLTHGVLGSLVLLAVFAGFFVAIFQGAAPLIDLVDQVLSAAGAWASDQVGGGLFGSFLESGVFKGFGAFLVFVPQIAVMFVMIELLEDSGYLARAAFLLDRAMGRAGLPGRAFLPLLSGFACAIPGIMATRTIANSKDRLVTMAVLPLMSCSARMPVYLLLLAALFHHLAWWASTAVVISMYLLGIVVALLFAGVLRRTVFRGGVSPLLLELPPYRLPSLRTVARNTARRSWAFVAGAGPIIFALSVVIWALLTFPRDVTYSRDYGAEIAAARAAQAAEDPEEAARLGEEVRSLESRREAERVSQSYLGRAGRAIEPAIRPLGWDWKVGVAVLGSFAAREVFVPTLGIVYSAGDEADEESEQLLDSIRRDRDPHTGRKVFTPLVGISLMVFYVLALQCMSTVAILRRETGSWRWPIGLLVGLTAVGYLAALVVYQGGRALGF